MGMRFSLLRHLLHAKPHTLSKRTVEHGEVRFRMALPGRVACPFSEKAAPCDVIIDTGAEISAVPEALVAFISPLAKRRPTHVSGATTSSPVLRDRYWVYLTVEAIGVTNAWMTAVSLPRPHFILGMDFLSNAFFAVDGPRKSYFFTTR